MALEYDLYVGEDLDLAGVILRLPGFKAAGRAYAGPGVTAWVGDDVEVRDEIIREELGIGVRRWLGFRVDLSAFDEGEGYLGMKTIVTTSLRVLEQGSFDAVLLFNGESPVLLRRSGRLILNKSKGFWRPPMLSLVKAPYAMEDLPTL